MDAPTPPSLPPANGNKRLWIILGIIAVVLALGIAAVVALGVFGYRRVQERRAAVREATGQIEKTVAEERAKMAESIRKGELGDGDSAIGRMKDQLEKSAGQLGTADAAAARAMAVFMGKLQGNVREYQTAATRFTEASVFNPTFRERAEIETHRQIAREFLAKNAQLADMMRRGDQLLRAELDAAKIPAATREATVAGFNRSQTTTRPLQSRIRDCDKALGEDALAILDLLDQSWGKWSHDEATGKIIFTDGTTLTSFNAIIERVQKTAADQAKAQQELVKSVPAARAQ